MWHLWSDDGFQRGIAQARPVTMLEHGNQQAHPFIHLGQFQRALVLPELYSVFGRPMLQIDSAIFFALTK